MIPKAYICHQLQDRTRLRVPSQKKRSDYFHKMENELRQCDGVRDVKVNPTTGSVLIFHRNTLDDIAKFCKTHRLFLVSGKSKPPESIDPWFKGAFDRLDIINDDLKKNTHGKWDVPTLAATGLLGLTVFQIFQRQWLPPAWTLFGDAFIMLAKVRNERKGMADLLRHHA